LTQKEAFLTQTQIWQEKIDADIRFFEADINRFDFFIIFLHAQKAPLFSADGFLQKEIDIL